VPAGHVVRSFRVKVMATPAKARQARELLVASGDAWAWCIDRYHARRRAGRPAANSNTQIWPDLRAHGPFGPLSVRAAQDVAKAWSAAFFESVRRRKAGEKAALPLSKHYERPVTWRHGDFQFVPAGVASRPRVSLQRARYHPRLVLAFSHPVPYPPESVRAVKLLVDGGELFLDVTSWVAISATRRVSGRIAGADPGIIHPLVLAAGPEALMISGRAVRSEEYLHLADTKARQAKQARRREPVKAQPGSPRQAGSRRWRSLGAKQRRAEARSRRRVRLAANRSARIAASWATDHQVEKVALGDPVGIERNRAGAVQNRRVGRWLRAYTRDALRYRLEEEAINLEVVDERGTSSHCPACGQSAAKNGRKLRCRNPACALDHHRDVAGAQNISRLAGAVVETIARVEHRRVGQPSTRRDHRRPHDRPSGRAAAGPARTRAAQQRESLAPQGEDSRQHL